MRLKQNMIDFLTVFLKDEILCRLLYYPPASPTDDPLSTSKPNLVGTPIITKEINKKRILLAPKTDDLIKDARMCRICMYFGRRSGNNGAIDNQQIVFDVYAHIDAFELVDVRSMWICDRISQLLEDERVTGIGKTTNSTIFNIANAPSGFIGYRLIYEFGSFKR